MSHYFALLSIVYMMGFVMLFDNLHLRKRNERFWKSGLLSRYEVDRLVKILAACQDG